MEQPILISIVVSIYNEWEYLDKCIDSIVNQTYKNIEIILVDDGSTDCCGEICDKYAEQDSRIIVIHKPNGGLVSARKAGTKKATGDYIINVDGDDWIEKERIQNLVKGIEQYHADIIYMDGYVREYPDNQVIVKGNLRRGFYFDFLSLFVTPYKFVKRVKKCGDRSAAGPGSAGFSPVLKTVFPFCIEINLCLWYSII